MPASNANAAPEPARRWRPNADQIPTKRLRASDLPSAGGPWSEIESFARTFDGYAAYPNNRCAEIANARLHRSIDEMRACLFFEHRRFRHFGDPPRGDDLAYVQELIEKLRAALEAAATPTAWPATGEDRQIATYWRTRSSGTLYTEVRLGGTTWDVRPWRGAAATRRLDAVVAEGEHAGPLRHRDFRGLCPGRRRAPGRAHRSQGGTQRVRDRSGDRGSVALRNASGEAVRSHLARTIVVARHVDSAMRWAAERLGVQVLQPLPPKTPNLRKSRRQYALDDARLRRLTEWRRRSATAGLVLTRVPIAGPASNVAAWAGSVQTFVDFVLVRSHGGAPGVVVFDPNHHAILSGAPELEIVFVSRHRLGRGAIGTVAAHALMLQEQYGRPVRGCQIICGIAEPAVAHACRELPARHDLPPFHVFEVGDVGVADADETAPDVAERG